MTTDPPSTVEAGDMMKLVGFEMTREAAHQAYEQSGSGANTHDGKVVTYLSEVCCPKGIY